MVHNIQDDRVKWSELVRGGKSMDYFGNCKTPLFLGIVRITVVISWPQAPLFMRQAKKRLVEGIWSRTGKQGFLRSAWSQRSDRPAVYLLLWLAWWLPSADPWRWLRLGSVFTWCGSYGAGKELWRPGSRCWIWRKWIQLTVMAVSWFANGIKRCGMAVSQRYKLAPALEKLRGKLSWRRCKNVLAVSSGACSLGILVT